MHPLLEAAFHGLEASQVRWALLRVPDELSSPSGDVDLLVHEHDRAAVRTVLEATGFVQLPAHGFGRDMFFLAYHAGTDSWVWLHIACDVKFGRHAQLRTDAAPELLSRRVRKELPVTLDPADAFWTLLLHCLLDKGNIAEKHRVNLRALAGSVDGDDSPASRRQTLARFMGQLLMPPWTTQRVVDAARRGDWAALETLPVRLRVPAAPLRVLSARLLRTFTRITDARRHGLVVALMGPDGAGKSTLARGIQSSFFFPSRSVYMGIGPGKIADFASKLKPLHHPPFTYFGFVGTLWLRYLTGQFHRNQGRLVVFDRYTYDALLPMPGGVSRLKDRALRIQAWVCPSPDLLLVLDVPGETMFKRKGEFSPEHLEAQRQTLLSLRERLPRVEVLDGTQPQDTVRTQAVERIWRRYADRMSRR